MVALPALSVAAAEWKVPLLRTTAPVGVPPLPATFTVTVSDCAVERLCEDEVTVTVGTTCGVTVMLAVPEALAYIPALAASGLYDAVRLALPPRSEPAGITMVAEPILPSAAAPDVKLPLLTVTEPVGVGMPETPVTATVTLNGCSLPMVSEAGVTVTLGEATVTDTSVVPLAAM